MTTKRSEIERQPEDLHIGAHNTPAWTLVPWLFTVFIGSSLANPAAAEQTRPSIPVDDLRLFTEVYQRIKLEFVEPIDDKTLIRQCVSGMVSGIDSQSDFMDKADYFSLRADAKEPPAGIGLELSIKDGIPQVISPIENSPAARAGIKSGDVIVRLGDKAVAGMKLSSIVKLIRGKPGTDMTVTVAREGLHKPLTFNMKRELITARSVTYRLIENGIGYVRITQFSAKTADQLKVVLDKLKSDNGGKLNGLALDLRDNPGGVLNSAVAVADAFLAHGMIVYTEARYKDAELKFRATPPDLIDGVPMTVLVNAGSAAASEILAGALQDHKRATIVGVRTFGRASIQTIIPLSQGHALKLTTARWRTPNGRLIHGDGITPDVVVPESDSASVDVGNPAQDTQLAQALAVLRKSAKRDSTSSLNEMSP